MRSIEVENIRSVTGMRVVYSSLMNPSNAEPVDFKTVYYVFGKVEVVSGEFINV